MTASQRKTFFEYVSKMGRTYYFDTTSSTVSYDFPGDGVILDPKTMHVLYAPLGLRAVIKREGMSDVNIGDISDTLPAVAPSPVLPAVSLSDPKPTDVLEAFSGIVLPPLQFDQAGAWGFGGSEPQTSPFFGSGGETAELSYPDGSPGFGAGGDGRQPAQDSAFALGPGLPRARAAHSGWAKTAERCRRERSFPPSAGNAMWRLPI